mgnify:CR=1 FL=1
MKIVNDTRKEDNLFIRQIVKDKRYRDNTLTELLQTRANMINSGCVGQYELAVLQYNIMIKDGRFDNPDTL